MVVFCDSHKQVAQTVIIDSFYFYLNRGEGAKQRHNWSTEGNKSREKNGPKKQGGRAAFPLMVLLLSPLFDHCTAAGEENNTRCITEAFPASSPSHKLSQHTWDGQKAPKPPSLSQRSLSYRGSTLQTSFYRIHL